MKFEELLDGLLLMLYKGMENPGMTLIRASVEDSGYDLDLSTLKRVKDILTTKKYVACQVEPKWQDYRCEITDKRVEFVKTSSFAKPGTSILDGEEDEIPN